MKGLAQAAIVLAIIAVVGGILMRLGMVALSAVSHIGLMKISVILLLLGINLELLELLKK